MTLPSRAVKPTPASGWVGVAWWQRLLGLLLMATALAVALFRAPDRPVQTLVARWAPPPSDFVDVKGQIVHLRDQGPRNDPLPIVLIHGTSASLHTWEGWVRALRTQRRVITFDLPGFGLTGPFAGQYPPDDYHGDRYARFVLDLMDKLQVQRAVLGGNSLGGEVAWRTAALAPQRVASLVLVDAAGPAFTPIELPLGFQIARVPVINRISEWFLPRALVVQSVASVYGDPARVTDALVDRYYELTLREGNRRALALRMQHLVLGDNAERIATLKLPTLILWGGRDRLIPPAVGQQFAQQITGSQLVVFDELGHVPQEEDAARSVLPVLAFLGLTKANAP
jgi:pimeloyl-ACP methyl ester carboxylesterase